VTSLAASAPAASSAAGAWHRVPLAGTAWSVWRDVCLRSAGFPADMVLAICDEPLARSADLAGADPAGRLAYDEAYADAAGRLSRAIAGTHADPVFQEAITWQNPGLAQFLHDHDAGPGAARRSKQRQRELVIANYLQRYCLKNDTIGFFGPVGWATAAEDAAGLVVVPGEQLLARRTTYFEVWAIDKVAAAIARQGRALGWLRPRRTRSVFLAGNVLHRPHRQPVTLTDAELRVLVACDGIRTISQALDNAGTPDARGLLARLAELGALRLDLEGPADAWPERLLREKLELIADPGARAAALAPVDQMIRARDAVAATAGDPAGLARALAGLAETFEQVTGSPATRRAGANYAGRTLVYQDAVRDVRVDLGQAVTGTLAGAGQSGHDGTDGDGSDGRNFLIRTAFQFAKNENFTETRWKRFECARQALSIVSGNRQSFRRGAGLRMQFLVEFRHEFHRAILLQPGIASIAHNLQKPGARVPPVKSTEKAVGAEHGLLCNVLRIRAAS